MPGARCYIDAVRADRYAGAGSITNAAANRGSDGGDTAVETVCLSADRNETIEPMTNLIHAAQSGDDAAFAELVLLYRPMAMRVAGQILRTEMAAEDAVQEAMIKVHRALPRFEEGNFRSWLLRIVTNTCYDHLRRAKRKRALSLDEMIEGNDDESWLPHSDDDGPEALYLASEAMSEILAAIDGLPFWHRNVLLMVDVQGMDYAEAAQYEGVPLGTVKSRLSRGRAALRGRIVR